MAAIERSICHKNDAWDKVAKEVSLERLLGRQMKKKFVVFSFFLKKLSYKFRLPNISVYHQRSVFIPIFVFKRDQLKYPKNLLLRIIFAMTFADYILME